MTDNATDTTTPDLSGDPPSLFDIASRAETAQAAAPEPEAEDVDVSDLDAAPDAPAVEAAAAEAPKPAEPNPYEERARSLEESLYAERASKAQLMAELEVAKEDAERLLRALEHHSLINERDKQFRALEIEKAVREAQAEKQAAAEAARAEAQKQYAHEQRVATYAREIPAACKAHPILSEAEIVDAIRRLPPNAPENIPEIARQLAEQKMAIYKRHVNEQRRAARQLPSAKSGTIAPAPPTPNLEWFESLMSRQNAGL